MIYTLFSVCLLCRKMSVKWAVVLVGDDDKEKLTVFNSDQCYFSMSVCVRWYSHDLTAAGIKRLRFYAARPVFYDANDQPLSNRFVSTVSKQIRTQHMKNTVTRRCSRQ